MIEVLTQFDKTNTDMYQVSDVKIRHPKLWNFKISKIPQVLMIIPRENEISKLTKATLHLFKQQR